MNQNLTKEEKSTLIVSVRRHNPKLSAWLEAHPKIALNRQAVNYGQAILEAGHGKERPPVGIIMKGVVEVQGDIQCLPLAGQNITYPLALRAEGETIGEVEHAAFRLNNGLWRRPWSAYSGMQTFYFTPLRPTKNSPFSEAKLILTTRAHRYQTFVAWLDPKDIDTECDAILNEISLTRLLTLTSIWLPEESDMENMYRASTVEEPGLSISQALGRNSKLTRKSVLLYREVVATMQGARLAFRPFTEEEMRLATPWENSLLVKWTDKHPPDFEDFLFLGIHNHTKVDCNPFIILPHFYCHPYSSPKFDHTGKVSIPGQFKSDLIQVALLASGYSESLLKRLEGQHTNVEGVREHEVIAVVTNNDMQKAAHSSKGLDKEKVIARLRNGLSIKSLKQLKDLEKLGFLGNASLVIFPIGS